MMSNPIQMPVLIDGLSTRKDGAIKIVLETREFNPEESAILFGMRGAEAWVIISPTEIKEEDVKLPTEKPDPAVGSKTPSQRLRNTLFLVWKQSNSGVDFESYYRMTLERVIDQFKEKLHD